MIACFPFFVVEALATMWGRVCVEPEVAALELIHFAPAQAG